MAMFIIATVAYFGLTALERVDNKTREACEQVDWNEYYAIK